MATRKFDKLNNLRSMPYADYFGEMDITEESKKERIALAESIEDVVLSVFDLIEVQKDIEYTNEQYIKSEFVKKMLIAITGLIVVDKYVNDYLAKIADLIVDATIKHIDDEYYLSKDRAVYIAENESNSLMNYEELQEAILLGFKEKKWVTMKDRWVRHSHIMVDDVQIPISKPFELSGGRMMFPKDYSLGASDSEIVNCRCSIKYI